jgi:Eukaryotic translation initiation factor 3 subunit 8 N-terminus
MAAGLLSLRPPQLGVGTASLPQPLLCLQYCSVPAQIFCIIWATVGLLGIPLQASAYLERKEDLRALPRIALRRIEHLYYKNDVVYDAMRRHVIAKQVRHRAICGEACPICITHMLRKTSRRYQIAVPWPFSIT